MHRIAATFLPAALLWAALDWSWGDTAGNGSGPGPGMRVPVMVNQAADGIVGFLYRKLNPPLGKGPTADQALAGLDRMVDQYEGTGVTHLLWNVNYQRVAYDSSVWPSYWDVPDPERDVTEWPRGYYELHKLGIDDVFARLIPRTRERGISPWISLRMNDHHYTGDPTRVSPLFFDHPELRVRGGTGLFNYARPEVRDHYLKLVAEVLERYDVDGLELDWIRTPDNFDSKDAERGREILTEFVRAVRRQTQAAATRRGHPVQLAVRVPARPGFAQAKGFEAVAWAREGLVDVVIPSDWWSGFNDTPVEDWLAQIGSGAPPCRIVPGTAATYACTAKGVQMMHNLAAMRGFAASMLDRGAGGIYLFNHFDPVDVSLRVRTPEGSTVKEGIVADLFRVAGSLAEATRQARVHALTIHDCVPSKPVYQPALPARIEPGKPVSFKIHSGPKPETGRCLIRVGLDLAGDFSGVKMAVRVNGQECREAGEEARPRPLDAPSQIPRMHVREVAPLVLCFEAPLAAVTRGYNGIELSVTGPAPQPQTVLWLEMALEP